MLKLTFVACAAVALLAVDSPAMAQRGRAGGAAPPASAPRPDKPSATGQEKGKSSAAGTKAEERSTDRDRLTVTEALHKNARLSESIHELLPGQDIDAASIGFRNLGQFVAAAEVSKNTGIPFSDLKMRIVDKGMNLGQAIKDTRPALDEQAETRKAEAAARERLKKAGADR